MNIFIVILVILVVLLLLSLLWMIIAATGVDIDSIIPWEVVKVVMITSFVGVIITAFVFSVNTPDMDDSDDEGASCGYCHRYYTSDDSGGNYDSIRDTNMCKNCYNNYKFGKEAIEQYNN